MRNLEARIRKLEQRDVSNREDVYCLLNEANEDIFERIRILYDAGIITGELIAYWIKQGNNSK